MMRKTRLARVGALTVLVIAVGVAGTLITGAFAQTDRAAAPVAKKWKIALSNAFIGQACARGILVVSYDNVVTAPCALKVNTDQFKFGQQLAQELVNRLHGKGNVIMGTGVAGTFADEERNKGAD